MKLGKELALAGKKFNLCNEWFIELGNIDDKDKLLQLYLEGIDFCLSNDFPTNDYIRKNFKGVMEKHHIFLDENLHLKNPSNNKCVALGGCTGIIAISDYNVAEIFLKHESEIELIAEGNAFVMVDIFDNARLKVVAKNLSRVCVNKYGDSEVNVEINDNELSYVKIIEKNKKTY